MVVPVLTLLLRQLFQNNIFMAPEYTVSDILRTRTNLFFHSIGNDRLLKLVDVISPTQSLHFAFYWDISRISLQNPPVYANSEPTHWNTKNEFQSSRKIQISDIVSTLPCYFIGDPSIHHVCIEYEITTRSIKCQHCHVIWSYRLLFVLHNTTNRIRCPREREGNRCQLSACNPLDAINEIFYWDQILIINTMWYAQFITISRIQNRHGIIALLLIRFPSFFIEKLLLIHDVQIVFVGEEVSYFIFPIFDNN